MRFSSKLFVTIALLSLVLSACMPVQPVSPGAEAPAPAASGDKVIKLGFMGPLTGGAAFIGTEQFGFVKVAVDIFNERTGMNVQLVEGDDEINPDVGKIVAERFVADPEIYVVVGPAGSQVCEATQPIFEAAGLAHITDSCTRTSLTQPGTPTFFRPIATDADQSKTDAAYLVNTLGATSVFLLDDQSSYSVGLNDEMVVELANLGVTDVERASVRQEETDFSSIVTSILAGGFDAVFFPNQIVAQEATLAVQLREQGYEGIYFLADGGFAQELINIAGEAANGTYVSFWALDPHLVPSAAEYTDRYAAEFNDQYGAFGGAAALTTIVALDAIERCADNMSRACVVDALKATDLQENAFNVPIKFDENNQLDGGQFFIYQVQDGTFTLLE